MRQHFHIHVNFESPPWAGHLPLRVGEPAGGSLTADEYDFAVTSPWAVAVSRFRFHPPRTKSCKDPDSVGTVLRQVK
jgi:hypothetical protein